VEFRVDKTGIIHNFVGKKSFTVEQLFDNTKVLLQAIVKARPSSVKGTYIKSIFIAPTMGPGIAVDVLAATKEIAS
jgi:large subunit ribosomal protein L1